VNSDDRTAIEQTVQTYLDGLYEGDADKLASVFHETSALTYEQDGKLNVLPRQQWLEAVRERGSPRSRGLARDDAILLVDQSGPTTAFVKVKCQIPPRHFTDYLSLLKVDGRWVVAQKVFATVVRS
jgi:Putative lumazine-binding